MKYEFKDKDFQFQPIVLTITLETQEELDKFTTAIGTMPHSEQNGKMYNILVNKGGVDDRD